MKRVGLFKACPGSPPGRALLRYTGGRFRTVSVLILFQETYHVQPRSLDFLSR